MPERLACCVPFCRSSRGDRKGDPLTDGMEWICSKHWGLVPKAMKRRRQQLKRRIKKLKRIWDKPKAQARIESSGRYLKYLSAIQRAYQAEYAAWDECKRAAIEAAAGIR